MARAQVQVVQSAQRTTFIYRLPAGWFTPVVWLWCVVGGLPIGIAAALIARAALDNALLFRAALVGLTVLGAAALYALYVGAVWRMALRVAFDRARDRVGYRPIRARGWTWLPRSSVEGFRLASGSGEKSGCTLLLDTRTDSLTLAHVDQDCYAQSGLPHLVARLNLQLEPAEEDTDGISVPAPLRAAAPLRPARRGYRALDEAAPRPIDLPTPPDDDD